MSLGKIADAVRNAVLAGRDAPLYHWMDATKAAVSFKTDRLRALFKHKGFDKKGISLTRNARYNHGWGGGIIRITFDQTKLAQRYKIVPLDAEIAVENPYSDRSKANKRMRREGDADIMAEEYLLNNIEPLHKYVKEIFIGSHNDDPKMWIPLLRFADKHSIPVRIRPRYQDDLKIWRQEVPKFDSRGNYITDKAKREKSMERARKAQANLEIIARGENFQPLYHITSTVKALAILQTGAFGLTIDAGNRAERKFRSGDRSYYLSTTRSTNGEYSRCESRTAAVHFVLDRSKLRAKYKIQPIDYWERSWQTNQQSISPSNHEPQNSSEMEDRVYARKPTIPIAGIVRAIHVFAEIDPDEDPHSDKEGWDRNRGRHQWTATRRLLIIAKKLGLDIHIWTDRKAFLNQNFSREVKIADLKRYLSSPEPEKPYQSNMRDAFDPYKELAYKKKRKDLSKQGLDKLRSMFSYPQDFISNLEAELYNNRKDKRDFVAKMEKAMRTHKATTPQEFLDAMLAKWTPIEKAHERQYQIDWLNKHEKDNHDEVFVNYKKSVESNPDFLEKLRLPLSKVAQKLADGWDFSLDANRFGTTWGQLALPLVQSQPQVEEAFARSENSRWDGFQTTIFAKVDGMIYAILLKRGVYADSTNAYKDPIRVWPQHIDVRLADYDLEWFDRYKGWSDRVTDIPEQYRKQQVNLATLAGEGFIGVDPKSVIDRFANGRGLDKEFQREARVALKTLTPDLSTFPKAWKQAIIDWAGTASEKGKYRDINTPLRAGKKPEGRLGKSTEELHKAAQSFPLPVEVHVYRGLHAPLSEDIEKLKPGQTYSDKAFLATSLDPERAAYFAKQGRGVLMHIILPQGSKGLYLGHPKLAEFAESEMLLPPNSKLVYKGFTAFTYKHGLDGKLYHFEYKG